jgi:FtsH-binding integral membrane protein
VTEKQDDKVRASEAEIRSNVRYTTICTLIALVGFVYLAAGAPPMSQGYGAYKTLVVIGMMFFAGSLGGGLYSIRGISKHTTYEDFKNKYRMSYLVRPLSAGICGVFVYILLIGGVLTLTLGQEVEGKLEAGGLMPYAALALLAGYGSHEFLKKVKDINSTIFALSYAEQDKDKSEDEKPATDSGN